MRRLLLPLALCLSFAVPASAQITVPFTFTAGTVANPTEVNTNFAKFADALNRTGGTMTGTLTSLQITPSATNTYDLGSAAALYRSGYYRTSLVFGQTTANYTLTWANPASARAISIADPGGTDVFTFNAATQTLTNKTLTAPAISSPVLSGTATGTYTLASPVLSGTVTGTYTIGGTPTFPATVPLTNAANTFTAAQTIALTDAGVGTKTSTLILSRIGAATSVTERMVGMAFNDANNPTLVGGVTGVRDNSSGNFLGGLAFFVHSTSGSAATDFTGLTEAARIDSSGFFKVNTTTDMTSSTSASFVTAGGAAIAKKLLVGTSISIGATTGMTVMNADATNTRLLIHDGTVTNTALRMIAGSATTFDIDVVLGNSSAAEKTLRFQANGGLSAFAGLLQPSGGFSGDGTTKHWGINSAGDHTFGASSDIADSAGTPTYNSGFGTGRLITGSDYAFNVLIVSASGTTTGTLNFGHTWTNAPSCVASADSVTVNTITTSTTTITLTFGSNTGARLYVLCRSF